MSGAAPAPDTGHDIEVIPVVVKFVEDPLTIPFVFLSSMVLPRRHTGESIRATRIPASHPEVSLIHNIEAVTGRTEIAANTAIDAGLGHFLPIL